ncbi:MULTISPECIES: DUF5316 family protein [Heyndrickxia]|uniref:DUF5316 family protein n=1 Tax=Heyndrickxia TaxID=2837504 RepID=UPI0020423F63|nr:DUF5316 family protein [Weizmannia agrestimuris]
MKAYAFIIGIIIAAIGIIAGLFTGDFSKTYWLYGIAAAIGIVFSGITMGAFVGGMETRANYFSETNQPDDAIFPVRIAESDYRTGGISHPNVRLTFTYFPAARGMLEIQLYNGKAGTIQ